jgi:hypothetical protein
LRGALLRNLVANTIENSRRAAFSLNRRFLNNSLLKTRIRCSVVKLNGSAPGNTRSIARCTINTLAAWIRFASSGPSFLLSAAHSPSVSQQAALAVRHFSSSVS